MWRDKRKDLQTIDQFLAALEVFQKEKSDKWELIENRVQMDNPPGTPGEDWIIPPDEDLVARELEQDPEYKELKAQIVQKISELKQIAHFIHFNEHHDFDFVNFTSPLIGNDALEDGLNMAKRLKIACERHNYVLQNLAALIKVSK